MMRTTGKGFTLLEAVVAIAIFSTSSVALYGWYATVLIGLVRANEQISVTEFSHNLDAHLSGINLTDEGSGQYSANGLTAFWDARLIEPKKDNRNIGGQIGYYRIGLYGLDIKIHREQSETPIDEFSTRLVCYEGVRVPTMGLSR
jgi:general secretion pathway protein I